MYATGPNANNVRNRSCSDRKSRVTEYGNGRKDERGGRRVSRNKNNSDDKFYQCYSEVAIRREPLDRSRHRHPRGDYSSSNESEDSLPPRGRQPNRGLPDQQRRRSCRSFRHESGGRRWIKPETFNGHGSFETILVQFENCAAYNIWNSADKAAH